MGLMFDLADKTALITGASGAIGIACAKVFRQQGASLMLAARRENILSNLCQELGENADFHKADLKNYKDIKLLIEESLKKLGKIDILINNAGATLDSLVLRSKEQDWDEILAINLKSAFLLCRAVIPKMMKQKYGRIINITSITAHSGNPGQASYCASKAGLNAFSKSLAKEVATRGITVNSIAPGFIESDMTAKLSEEHRKKYFELIPIGKAGNPKDVAFAALFLASEEAKYITGATLHVNGGMLML